MTKVFFYDLKKLIVKKSFYTKKMILYFMISIFVMNGFFGDSFVLYDRNSYVCDIKQTVGLPSGTRVVLETPTIPYDKTVNGEVDLTYTITIPQTSRKKSYDIYILLPNDISPSISSYNVVGNVEDCNDISNADQETYNALLSLFPKIENFSDYYYCYIDTDLGKASGTYTIGFTIKIPSYYKGNDIKSYISSSIFIDRKIHKNKTEVLSAKLYSLKVK